MTIAENSLIEIVHNQVYMGQQTLNVWQFNIDSLPGTPSLVQVLEGYWNNIKATTRALAGSGDGDIFLSLRGREMNNPAGDYAEFDIPLSERTGTRVSSGDKLPAQAAVGCRLVVGTRITKPGQKRYAFIHEGDNTDGVLQSGYRTPLVNHLNVMIATMTLGAPAALTVLTAQICKKDNSGFVVSHQPITGFIINTNISSQNSRKIGRGA